MVLKEVWQWTDSGGVKTYQQLINKLSTGYQQVIHNKKKEISLNL